jgi:polyhydroxyalkanoate synthesis regulator phasin
MQFTGDEGTMEPQDRKQLSQADQAEHAEQLADRLSEQYRGATEGTSPDHVERLEARIAALEIRIAQLEAKASTNQQAERSESEAE